MPKSQPRAWQRMLSGRRLDLLDPTPVDIEIEDIAHGLAFVARWNGQTNGDYAYSVAEHSILVTDIHARLAPDAPVKWRLAALLHDAPEYVIGDMISPVKAAVGPGYGAVDDRLTAAIHLRFGLPATLPKSLGLVGGHAIGRVHTGGGGQILWPPRPVPDRGPNPAPAPARRGARRFHPTPRRPDGGPLTQIRIRPAHTLDHRDMAELLSEIIAIGGTTAITGRVTAEDITAKIDAHTGRNAWHVAETDDGEIVGFQWIAPLAGGPDEAADIATFAKPGRQGLGIGSKLFDVTRAAAKRLGYGWINANIRADNSSGLTYYQSRGFEDYGRVDGYRMDDGTLVDKILKRYDLR